MEFRIGSIPVKVHSSFAITAVLLSLGVGMNIPKLLVVAAVMFVSIILHELGHAYTGMAFGLVPRIDLHGMGGTTSWTRGRNIGWGRSIVISAAGPLTGILFGGIAYLLVVFLGAPQHELVMTAINAFIFISAIWGAANLAPILPLDGGNILLAFLQIVTRGKGERIARYVSIVFAVAALGLSWRYGFTWAAVLCGLFLFRNVQALRQGGRMKVEADLYGRLKEGFSALDRKDGAKAIVDAEIVLEHTAAPQLRFEALRLLAYARILEGQWGPLMALVERTRLELGPTELERIENAATELDRPEEAKRIRELREAPAAVSGFRA